MTQMLARLTCVLLAILASSPIPAQIATDHEDDAWANDRVAPYAGSGWSESAGGSPPVDFPSQGLTLRGWIPLLAFDPTTTGANDIWGYVSPSGREYALIGLSLGTAVVEVTDPGAPRIVDVLPGPTSDWRDLKTYESYAYAVSEGGGGIQVFDLSQVDDGTVTLANTVRGGGRTATHNVAVDEQSALLYRAGGGDRSLGLRIYDLADPSLPVLVGEWSDRYCHDALAVTWTEAPREGVPIVFCFANDITTLGNPGIEILDVSDAANPSVIGSVNLALPPIFSHPASYSHQGWLSPDRRYLYFDDEVDEAAFGTPTLTRIIDLSDLANPLQRATFSNGNGARDHNLFVRDHWIFEANYRSGLRVFDATDPLAPVEVAFFDSWPEDDLAHYNGLWGVYPFLPSGTVVGSDIEKGLFVWTLDAVPGVPAAPAAGLLVGALALAVLALCGFRGRRA